MSREDVEQLPFQRGARQHPVQQVRPIEGSDELERILQGELRGDVLPHARRGRGGKCVEADARQ
jgi:hypothetical protein